MGHFGSDELVSFKTGQEKAGVPNDEQAIITNRWRTIRFKNYCYAPIQTPNGSAARGRIQLGALANKALPPNDPAWQHIWKCSRCFAEFKELRDARRLNERSVRRKRNVYWATAAGIILLCIGAALAAFFLNQPKVPQRDPVANVPTPTPTYPAAVLNLEGVSTTRSGEKSSAGTPVQIQTLPRRIVDLTVYLPRGSEDGDYQLQFLNSRDDVLLSAKV